MTYNEALRESENMKQFEGCKIIIKDYGNENFFPTYVSCGMGMGMESMMMAQEHSVMLHSHNDVCKTTPPAGRSQKQHNLIQSLNKRF